MRLAVEHKLFILLAIKVNAQTPARKQKAVRSLRKLSKKKITRGKKDRKKNNRWLALRYAKNGLLDVNQLRHKRVAHFDDRATRHRQIAIKPSDTN